MKHIKPIILLFAFLASVGINAQTDSTANEEGLVWYTDLMQANDSSIAQNKPIFAFFTGSDWCGWCWRLQRNVFAKPAFIKWAKENVILLELDFPRKKKLPQELAQQNVQLQQAFKVSSYPTIWFFTMAKDDSGQYTITAIGSTGYPGGAIPGKEEEKFLANANEILAKQQ